MTKKILLIDDDPTFFEETRSYIEVKSNNQFLVIPEDYSEMGEAFNTDNKDVTIWEYIPRLIKENAEELCLIICDIRFNQSDNGLQLIGKIRNDPDYFVYPDHLFNQIVPIIALTSHPDREKDAILMGANYSLHKTDDPSELTKFMETINRQVSLYDRINRAWIEYMWPNSIKDKIRTFKQKNRDTNIFLMTSFEESHMGSVKQVIQMIHELEGIKCHMADAPGGENTDYLLQDVAVFMHGCDYGIAFLFKDSDKETVISPSVCLEIGYMRALQKPILLFTEVSLPEVADFQGISKIDFEKSQLGSEWIKHKLYRWILNQLMHANMPKQWY